MAQLSGECISKATRTHDVAQSNCAYSVAYKSIKERVFTLQVATCSSNSLHFKEHWQTPYCQWSKGLLRLIRRRRTVQLNLHTSFDISPDFHCDICSYKKLFLTKTPFPRYFSPGNLWYTAAISTLTSSLFRFSSDDSIINSLPDWHLLCALCCLWYLWVLKYVTLSRVFSLVELLLCGAAAVACVAYKSAFKGFSIF